MTTKSNSAREQIRVIDYEMSALSLFLLYLNWRQAVSGITYANLSEKVGMPKSTCYDILNATKMLKMHNINPMDIFSIYSIFPSTVEDLYQFFLSNKYRTFTTIYLQEKMDYLAKLTEKNPKKVLTQRQIYDLLHRHYDLTDRNAPKTLNDLFLNS